MSESESLPLEAASVVLMTQQQFLADDFFVFMCIAPLKILELRSHLFNDLLLLLLLLSCCFIGLSLELPS